MLKSQYIYELFHNNIRTIPISAAGGGSPYPAPLAPAVLKKTA